jgi:hypothetical protein
LLFCTKWCRKATTIAEVSFEKSENIYFSDWSNDMEFYNETAFGKNGLVVIGRKE